MAPVQGYRAPSVARALKILEAVAWAGQGLGISELARRLGISKGTVSGICAQLEAQGALLREPASKRYLLGPLVAALAGRDPVYARLQEAARPELSALRDEFGESFFLGVAAGGQVMVVEARQPAGVMGVSAGPGTKLPLTAGAVGKVMLAESDPAWLRKNLPGMLKPYTPQSIIDPDAYGGELGQVRQKGFALERDEYLSGVWGAAVSLGRAAGVPAAIWSVGFTSSLGTGRLEELAQALMAAKKRVLSELG